MINSELASCTLGDIEEPHDEFRIRVKVSVFLDEAAHRGLG